MKSKIGIFIPCYNVERSIGDVLCSFSSEILNTVEEVVVVDNCSQDKTLSILKEIQSSSGLIGRKLVIIQNKKNYGLGGSQKIAYQYFIDQQFSHFFIVHGDNQGDGEEIAKSFLDVYRAGPPIDVVIASRFLRSGDTKGYSWARTMGNHVFNILTFLLTGQRMSDSGAAIIFYRTEILKKFPFVHLTNGLQFNPQLNILMYADKALKIKEVPLHWRDSKDEGSMKAFQYCQTLLKILLGYRWRKTFLRKTGWEAFYNESQKVETSFEVSTNKNSVIARSLPAGQAGEATKQSLYTEIASSLESVPRNDT
jgi:glycosyltransferase involved in cell wall biosynthesis